MVAEKLVWKILNFGRNSMTTEQTRDLSVGILAISKGHASKLRLLAEKMNLKDVLLKEASQLPLTEETKNELTSSLGFAMNQLSFGELTDFFMLHAEALEETSQVTLVDQLISHVNQTPKGTITVPHQVTEIVSHYFNMPANSTLHSPAMVLGLATTDLMELNEDVIFYGQGLDNHSFMLAELRFYMRNINVQLAYGDVISKPRFTEGNQLKQFNFIYMTPPFGAKINEEQEKAIESDSFGRFNYFGKPSKANLDFGYVISGLNALKDDGKAAFLVPTGVLYRGGADQKIRERFLYADIIEAVIELPAGLLAPYTGISTALVLFNKNKPGNLQKQIMMINAENLTEIGPARTKVLTEAAMKLIKRGLTSGEEVAQISRLIANSDLKDAQVLPSYYIFETQMDFKEYGKVKFNLSAFDELNAVPLKKLATLYRGYNALPRNIEENGPYAVLKIADVEKDEIDYDGLTYYKVEERTKVDNYRIQKGDVILSIRGQSLKIAVFEQERDDVLLSQNFVGIRCGRDLDPDFLKMYFESPTVQFIFNSKLTGSTVMNLPIKEVEALAVPVLSVEKQSEIVELYKVQQKEIQLEIESLQTRLKRLKLDSFNEMGLVNTYSLYKQGED
ncbi:N-6 DNA methylase [Psychrobacillus sp. NPDC093180]|uniref:N-6 DNA methylase n=1 Tax=Psychrobacillus sp. NPDC093180 TaxID=3364489 RepID=UPI0038052D97